MISRRNRNCSSLARASKIKFLIDGQEYYDAFYAAAQNAKRSIYIIGWEIDSRTILRPDHSEQTLGDFLDSLSSKNPELQINILVWDSPFYFSLGRDLLLPLRLGMAASHHIRLCFDCNLPSMASHHQKLILVDDSLVFVGGFDLADERWDTRLHAVDDTRRTTSSGSSYLSNHDVQAMLTGPIVSHFTTLVREYWKRATGSEPNEVTSQEKELWIDGYKPDIENVFVSLSRTECAFGGKPAKREIERLYIDAIEKAKKAIYIENQYLTATKPLRALAKRLQEKDGPDVLIVAPKGHYSFLERAALELLRYKSIKRLKAADRWNRLKIFTLVYPDRPEQSIKVHSKLLIVDDAFITLGSANLNNRSMGLDTECNIAIEAETETHRKGVEALRNSLLAEHLCVSELEFTETCKKMDGDVFATIRALHHGGSHLTPYEDVNLPELRKKVTLAFVGDLYEPLDHDLIQDRFKRVEPHPVKRHPLLPIAFILLALLLFGFIVKYVAQESAVVSESLQALRLWKQTPIAGFFLFVVIFFASLVFVPLNGLILSAAIVFPDFVGFLVTYVAILASSATGFGLGKVFGEKVPIGKQYTLFTNLTSFFERKGILAITALRILPVAPFSVVNFASGYFKIPFRSFIVGSALGFAPGMALIFLFTNIWQETLSGTSVGLYIIATLAIAAWLAVIWNFKRKPQRGATIPS